MARQCSQQGPQPQRPGDGLPVPLPAWRSSRSLRETRCGCCAVPFVPLWSGRCVGAPVACCPLCCCVSLTGLVRPTGSRRPQVRPTGSRRPQVRPTGSRRPQARATGSRRPQVRPTGSRRPQVRPTGSRRPQVRPTGSRRPQVRATGSRCPQVRATGRRRPQGWPTGGRRSWGRGAAERLRRTPAGRRLRALPPVRWPPRPSRARACAAGRRWVAPPR